MKYKCEDCNATFKKHLAASLHTKRGWDDICPSCRSKNLVEYSDADRVPVSTILDEAKRAVVGDRADDYDDPRVNHARTAALWNAYLHGKYGADGPQTARHDITLTATDVCLLNVLQKISRLENKVTRDGLVDIAGYSMNVAIVEGFEDAEEYEHLTQEDTSDE